MSKTTETNTPNVDWEELKTLIAQLHLHCEQCTPPEHLVQLANFYNYTTYDIFTHGEIQGEELIGVVVTNQNIEVDNGVYIFHVSKTGRIMLSVLHPSTIDRQHIVNRAVLDIETLLDGAKLPVLTPDDIVRVTYELLKRQICDVSAKEQKIPEDKKAAYSKIYMDLLLANLTLYHQQDDAYRENIVNDQPHRIYTVLMHPELAQELEKQVRDEIKNRTQNEEPVEGALPC